MSRVHSFEPVIGVHPRMVILGSMPGTVSLEAVQYYANPRNAFWKIMAELFGISFEVSYDERIRQIKTRPVILWDSLKSCHRPGSLDSNIQRNTAQANDFAGLLKQYPDISLIAFNGAASEKYFRQLALPELPDSLNLKLIRMPSTSPANAAMSFEAKLVAWRRLLDCQE
jgi:TDG/mug DNA glycosylase family protein